MDGDGVSRKSGRIYALRESASRMPMYIGKAFMPLRVRLQQHIAAAKNEQNNTLVVQWVRAVNFDIVIEEIAVVGESHCCDVADICRSAILTIEAAMTEATARRTLVCNKRLIANCQNNPFREHTGAMLSEKVEQFLTNHCGIRRGAKMFEQVVRNEEALFAAQPSEVAR